MHQINSKNMRIGSSNPTFGKKIFNNAEYVEGQGVMTVGGTVNKTILLFLLVALSATITWKMAFGSTNPGLVKMLMIGGGIGGFVMALITAFKPKYAMYTAPVYALLEGLLLGAISAFIDMTVYPGIAFQAVGATFGVFIVILFIYKTGIIKPTQKFKQGLIAATFGIAIFYLLNMILGWLGYGINLGQLGWMGIGIQAVIVIVAALNLVLDFDFINQGSEQGLPKYMEWYSAFGLMVTLVWLYLEILRLLSLLANRN